MTRSARFFVACVFSNALSLSSPGALAENLQFDTYSDAIDGLIFDGSNDPTCEKLMLTVSGPNDDEIVGITGGLAQVCNVKTRNIFEGSSLSSTFSSPIPTRGYVPLSFGTLAPPPPPRPPTPSHEKSDLVLSSRGIGSAGQFSIGVNLEFEQQERDADAFSPSSSQDRSAVALTASYHLANKAVLGLTLARGRLLGRGSGAMIDLSDEELVKNRDQTPEQTTASVLAFQDLCAGLGEEVRRGDETRLGLFGSFPVGGEANLSIWGATERRVVDYAYTSCSAVIVDAGPNEFYASRITGEQVNRLYNLGFDFRWPILLGGQFFVPHLGLSAQRLHVDPRIENDEATPTGLTVDQVINNETNAEDVLPTGFELAYDGAKYDSLQSRIGVTWFRPLGTRGQDGVIWADLTHVFEFGQTDRVVTARFAGDQRADPTRFSFNTAQLDQSYFELSFGGQRALGRGLVLLGQASAVLGYTGRDDWRVVAGVRMNF